MRGGDRKWQWHCGVDGSADGLSNEAWETQHEKEARARRSSPKVTKSGQKNAKVDS